MTLDKCHTCSYRDGECEFCDHLVIVGAESVVIAKGRNRGTAPGFRTVLGVIRDPCGSLVASQPLRRGFRSSVASGRCGALERWRVGDGVVVPVDHRCRPAGEVRVVLRDGPSSGRARFGVRVRARRRRVHGRRVGRRRRGGEVRCPAVSRGRGFVGRAGPRIVYTTASVGAPGFVGTTVSVGARGWGIVGPGCVAIGQGIGGPAPGITWRFLR